MPCAGCQRRKAKLLAAVRRVKAVLKPKQLRIKPEGRAVAPHEVECLACNDTGVLDLGSSEYPCSCRAGDKALFNVADRNGPITGAELNGKPRVRQEGTGDAPKRAGTQT